MKRRSLLASAAVAPLFAVGKPALAADKVLNIGAAVFPDSLRAGTASFASLSLLNQTNDQLITRDNKGDLHPALATKWELIDPLTMRFTLRQGVKFTDGVEFTAEDVAFTIKYVLDPQTAYAQAARINQVATATVVDKYTVDIKTKAVFPTLLRGLSDIIMQPKHYVEKVGINGFANKPMGTGPFIFQEWVPGDHYTLTANKNYWGGAPKIDKVVIRTIPDGSTRVASLVSGESHIVEEIPIDLIDQVNASGSTKIDQIATTVGLVLTFDPTIKPFDNARIREAFDYAIDKPLILKQILKGQGDILQGQVLTRDALGFNPDLKARPLIPRKRRRCSRSRASTSTAGADHHPERQVRLGHRHLPGDRRHAEQDRRQGDGEHRRRRRLPADEQRPEVRPAAHDRLVQSRRRRLRHRLVHQGRPAHALVQRRVRQDVRRRALDQRHRRAGQDLSRDGRTRLSREPVAFPVRPAEHLWRRQECEGLRRRCRQGPAPRPGRARQVTAVP